METLPLELPSTAPRPGAALVLERWNSWARLYFPETQEWTWVDLAETGFERLPRPAASAEA